MKIVPTLHLTVTETHFFSHGFLTNRTDRITLQFHPDTQYNCLLLRFLLLLQKLARHFQWHLKAHILEDWPRPPSLRYSMLPSEEIRELTVDISSLPNDGIIDANPKDFKENVCRVYTVVVSCWCTGTLELGANRSLVFIIESVPKSKTKGSALTHQKQRYP